MDTIMNYNTSSGSQVMPEAWLERTGAEVVEWYWAALMLTGQEIDGSCTHPGWNWGKRRLHQPTFTQWSGKGLKNYCRFNLLRKHKAATKSFWKRVWVQFPIYQVLAGALESHWNALKDDEVYKREINADPTIFRMRSSSAYCSCQQCLLHCIICFVLPLIVIANAIIIISVIIIVTLISVIIIKLQSGGLK